MRTRNASLLSNNGTSHSPGSVVWFISFGDLLTLLLCFFLVLTPWDRLSNPIASEESQGVAPKNSSERPSGTSLAHQPTRGEPELLAAVPVHSGLMLSQDGVAEAKLLGALEDAMRPHVGTGSLKMTVVLCPAVANQRGGFLAKVLPLVGSQGFSQAALEVEVAAVCDEDDVSKRGEEVAVGSVKVSRM